MSEDVTNDLKAFTPVGLDCDAVLFAAGKAAARQWAGWKWLTVALLVTNAVTIGVQFWPQPMLDPPPVLPLQQPPALPVQSPQPFTAEPYSYIALSQGRITPTVADHGPPAEQVPLNLRAIYDSTFP